LDVSRPEAGRLPLLLWLLLASTPIGLRAQVEETAFLRGTVFVADSALRRGTVVLHHLSDGAQGEMDSTSVGADGGFSFRLPNVPDAGRSDVFFASLRHHGVLYFGPAITAAVQLDSVYEIHAFDTLLAPPNGLPIALESRSVFFEPDSVGWRVTDLFQLRNDEARTIVARADGKVWSHPLPAEARQVVAGEGEVSFDAASYEEGALVVRAALPPGERLFVVRYRVDSPFIAIPTVGQTGAFDVLIREPAPPLDVEGLEFLDRIELEAGTTYLRFAGADVGGTVVRVVESSEPALPPVRWVAVILSLVLAASGVMALTSGPRSSRVPVIDRASLLLQVAHLDEDFERSEATPADRRVYERRRAELLARIRSVR